MSIKKNFDKPDFEFHISRKARDRYEFSDRMFSMTGRVIIADFHAARLLAQKMNEKRDLLHYPEKAVRAGQINAMGLMDEIFHYVASLFREQRNPETIRKALDRLERNIGKDETDNVLRVFTEEFPPVSVYRGEETVEEYLAGQSDDRPNREAALEELLMLWLSSVNPGLKAYDELFDVRRMEKLTHFRQAIEELKSYFTEEPRFGPENKDLIEMLMTPGRKVPHSIEGQIEYILKHWSYLLGEFAYRALRALDLLSEEEKMSYKGLKGPGPSLVPDYLQFDAAYEPEAYSSDLFWMPRLVLLAKNTYVWLDQLSRQYGREIRRLDQLPEQELEIAARRGFTGLWLIGIWERSAASRVIKQACGNPEAVPSAYSIYDYTIAEDLGGEEAFAELKERAWKYGLRLAGDMVPNHMGIDSHWVINHPERFISSDRCPFPVYSFTGPDLSSDPRVSIYIEDHYYSRSDAAVTFKRIDNQTGEVKYIYHGNDGTDMPWNDTAQLDYLKDHVREAVIQKIIEVARKTPIIRFDAAMTLTKRHYQRLWFPEPGSGGDIPSRSEYGMTKSEFNNMMPKEFWRQVVDRVAEEAPDTLLLAEAFWLMEGFFVRTLGMHRVYNSAFMNMLRDEDNAKYRSVMKNTLEFDPEILKRFVNFMNNPDEKTAVEQFGKDDKYFGVCIMLATLPGLPMFGHGQLEGYREKYGMEYRRAYMDEQSDQWLLERHEQLISPLLHSRSLFAEVQNFLLYDFYTEQGSVDENVFAYSNSFNDKNSLVVYHNKYAETAGWIKTSVSFAVKEEHQKEPRLVSRGLAEGLNLSGEANKFCIFRDHVSNLHYIRRSGELAEKGLFCELGAYQYHVFLDFKEVRDTEDKRYSLLNDYLNGRGVPDLNEATAEVLIQKIRSPFARLFDAEFMDALVETRSLIKAVEFLEEGGMKILEKNYLIFLHAAARHLELPSLSSTVFESYIKTLRNCVEIFSGLDKGKSKRPKELKETLGNVKSAMKNDADHWIILLGWLNIQNLGRIVGDRNHEGDPEQISLSWMDEWNLNKVIYEALGRYGANEEDMFRSVAVVKILVSHGKLLGNSEKDNKKILKLLKLLFGDPKMHRYLGLNRHKDTLWYNQESFEELIHWLYLVNLIQMRVETGGTNEIFQEKANKMNRLLAELLKLSRQSEFQVEKLLDAAEERD